MQQLLPGHLQPWKTFGWNICMLDLCAVEAMLMASRLHETARRLVPSTSPLAILTSLDASYDPFLSAAMAS